MMCENCKKNKEITEIKNYVVNYTTWEAWNCCCKECAREKAKKELNIRDCEINSID